MNSAPVLFSEGSKRGFFDRQPHSASFKDILNGDNAFYNQAGYLKDTERDFAQDKPLPVSYTWNTENKTIRIAKQIFSIIIFPIGIYRLLHALAGKVLLPVSSPRLFMDSENRANKRRAGIVLNDEWKYKRITVEVDGYKIDAMIVGKASTLNNGRWMLVSNGNAEFYETQLSSSNGSPLSNSNGSPLSNSNGSPLSNSNRFKQILSKVNGNAIVFNYPGVGASSGLPNRQAMAKAYRAMLSLLEDRKNGIGAKEIIGYGFSIGGGVQGDALKTHELKKDVKYVFVKDRTFSDLSTIASILTYKPLGFLVKILGWNIDSVESSKKLQAPEIIMQSAQVRGYEELNDSSKIIDDGVISANASLAKALLEDIPNNNCPKHNKVFIGMQERHNNTLKDPSFLAEKIEALLKNQNSSC